MSDLGPGAHWMRGALPIDEQREVLARCRALAAGPPPMYTPTVRGGAKMRVGMLCLGRHWNALTYRYEDRRSDFDGLPVPPLPDDLATLARRLAAAAGYELEPDICVVNYYTRDGRMGLHQDKDERPETLAAGIPIVSVSIGDTARFMLGGTRRKGQVDSILLASGDALVLGGAARLRYHGVSRILPATAPEALGIEGRFNLTFRQYSLSTRNEE
jgi:DNA alkylation damage repair protein AlkB